jgi:hypothetical protein
LTVDVRVEHVLQREEFRHRLAVDEMRMSPGESMPSAAEPGCTSSTTSMPVSFG